MKILINKQKLEEFKKQFFSFFPYNGEDKHHYFWADLNTFISQNYLPKTEAIPKAKVEKLISDEFYKLEELEKDFNTNQDIIRTRNKIQIKLNQLK